ncbi:MAG: hypothetical protein LUH51_06605, partial [Firmicutes bacterium]|nr:hypothetical protein [Bacillota bacterium]
KLNRFFLYLGLTSIVTLQRRLEKQGLHLPQMCAIIFPRGEGDENSLCNHGRNVPAGAAGLSVFLKESRQFPQIQFAFFVEII